MMDQNNSNSNVLNNETESIISESGVNLQGKKSINIGFSNVQGLYVRKIYVNSLK